MRALTEDEAARVVNAALSESADALQALRADATTLSAIARAAALIVDAFGRGGRMFSCGNGGSMCDAMHLAEELSGRFRGDRKGLPAQAISDAGYLSCVANDFGYERCSPATRSHARAGDVPGRDQHQRNQQERAGGGQRRDSERHETIVLTGPRSPLAAGADCVICTPGGRYADRVQELHIKVIHILIELIERDLFPENYAAAR